MKRENTVQTDNTASFPLRILFVCLGNICRSSAAQAIMQRMVDHAGETPRFHLDSAGLIAYHQGEPPDGRMRAHASRRGYRIDHLSRPVREEDFFHFDMILGMDDSNVDRLRSLAPSVETMQKIGRMTDYCQRLTADHVPDPYYGGATGFERVLDILEDACEGLFRSVS